MPQTNKQKQEALEKEGWKFEFQMNFIKPGQSVYQIPVTARKNHLAVSGKNFLEVVSKIKKTED